MKKKIIFFLLAVCISLAAAVYRWSDSAHAIGVIKASGGEARHAVTLESGRDSYMLIATATVIPPYRGDVNVVLEGEPKINYQIHSSGPIVDLGLYQWPQFKDNTFIGLKPKDRPALWVEMRLPEVDPVCGMPVKPDFIGVAYKGVEYHVCSKECLAKFNQDSESYKDRDRARGRYTLAFYDKATGKSVLNIPVIFKGKGEVKDAGEHHH
jgi:YHS domain-containing protein